MSLLLKSVWRNVLRGSPLSLSITPRSLSSGISELSRNKTDPLAMEIKSSCAPRDVLACVQAHLPQMTHSHMLQALRTLFELHKTQEFRNESESLIRNPTFGLLCQNFKKHARELDVNETIEATKVLSFLRVPADTVIVQTLLQMLRCNINMLNLRHIMFLDFILGRYETSNHLVDALKLALPLAFQIHLPLELDNQDLPLLKDMLAYCCTRYLPDRCINNVVTGLLLHDQTIDAQTAKSIIWSLCQVNCTEDKYPTRVQLLHICYDILAMKLDHLTYDDVLRTTAKIKGRILEKHPEYYHEQLMDAVADYVIKNEIGFEKGLLVARVLSRIAHTHLGLVGYLCGLAVASPGTLSNARTNILFGFVNCLANNNFTPDPDQWADIRHQISNNPILDGTNIALPWAKLCLEMASLGHYEDKLLQRVFSKDFLESFLSRHNNTLDYLQLLTLHEAVNAFHDKEYSLPSWIIDKAKAMYPVNQLNETLEEYVAKGLGGREYVAKNVVLPSGILADVLTCIKNGYPLPLKQTSNNLKTPIQNMDISDDALVICLLNFTAGCFSMNSNRLRGTFRLLLDILEKQGYIAVGLNINEWLHAPPHERTPYLLREIGYKCGEVGMKLSVTGWFNSCESQYSFVLWVDGKPLLRKGQAVDIPDNYVAKATYSNAINTTGWAFLEIKSSVECEDDKQAYAAGMLEGYLTRDLIWMHWQNMLRGYCYNKSKVCALIEAFVDKNEDYVSKMVRHHPNDPYWYQIKLYYIQLEGLAAGYNIATKVEYELLTVRDITWINMLGDLDELAMALTLPKINPKGWLFDEHCTGLVKLLPELKELYVAHTTWNSYQSMLRLQKLYVLNYRLTPGSEKVIPGYTMSMSSYPAFVQSTDDFYIISSGLVASETTIGNSNRNLFAFVKPTQVFEFVRVMVANRLARSGKEWTQLFRQHNSGTYNNQWFIVDYNRFSPGASESHGQVLPGLLWVVEQLPGYTEAQDLTEMLLLQTYYPSYNIPFFPRVFARSGGNQRIQLYGEWFGYHTNPRARILKEKQAEIHNLHDMYDTMRYNDFKHDPLSRCSACVPPYSGCNAIAARNDLNPANGTYPFRALGHRSHGSTDAKVTSAELMKRFLFVAVSSPAHNISRGIPPFQWSKFDMGTTISHLGHPDLWMFKPLVHVWEWA